jgi:hypothetical protein
MGTLLTVVSGTTGESASVSMGSGKQWRSERRISVVCGGVAGYSGSCRCLEELQWLLVEAAACAR